MFWLFCLIACFPLTLVSRLLRSNMFDLLLCLACLCTSRHRFALAGSPTNRKPPDHIHPSATNSIEQINKRSGMQVDKVAFAQSFAVTREAHRASFSCTTSQTSGALRESTDGWRRWKSTRQECRKCSWEIVFISHSSVRLPPSPLKATRVDIKCHVLRYPRYVTLIYANRSANWREWRSIGTAWRGYGGRIEVNMSESSVVILSFKSEH